MKDKDNKKNQGTKGVVLFYHIHKTKGTGKFTSINTGFTYIKFEEEETESLVHALKQVPGIKQAFKSSKGVFQKRSEQEQTMCRPRSQACYRSEWGVAKGGGEANLQPKDLDNIEDPETAKDTGFDFPDQVSDMPALERHAVESYARHRRGAVVSRPAPVSHANERRGAVVSRPGGDTSKSVAAGKSSAKPAKKKQELVENWWTK